MILSVSGASMVSYLIVNNCVMSVIGVRLPLVNQVLGILLASNELGNIVQAYLEVEGTCGEKQNEATNLLF